MGKGRLGREQGRGPPIFHESYLTTVDGSQATLAALKDLGIPSRIFALPPSLKSGPQTLVVHNQFGRQCQKQSTMWYKVQWGYFMHTFLIFFFILAKQCSKEDCTCIKKSSLCRVGLGHFFLCLLSALFHNYPRRRVCITWLPSKALQFCYLSKIKSLPIP